MFRRRRVEDADELPPAERPDDISGEMGEISGEVDVGQAGPEGDIGTSPGPWDVTQAFPERERIDLGSLRVPSEPGLDVQVNFTGDQALAVIVVRGDSMLQLQAFAAPKRAGLWDDIRRELIDELTAAGGRGEEAEGPFGPEVQARVPAEPGDPHGLQPARFLGADGPRWFLRGVISGPAAARAAQAKVLEDVFADTVVVRGEHPMPPRDLLELRLPAEAQQALEEQMAQEAQARELPEPVCPRPRDNRDTVVGGGRAARRRHCIRSAGFGTGGTCGTRDTGATCATRDTGATCGTGGACGTRATCGTRDTGATCGTGGACGVAAGR